MMSSEELISGRMTREGRQQAVQYLRKGQSVQGT